MFEKYKKDIESAEEKFIATMEEADIQKVRRIAAIIQEQAQTVVDLSDVVIEKGQHDAIVEDGLKHHLKTLLSYLKEGEKTVLTALKIEIEREEKETDEEIL